MRAAVALVCILVSGVVHAAVYLQEAARVAGVGADRVGWSLWYSGACGERVGVQLAYRGQRQIEDVLPDVAQYARDSVAHVLARCPAANVIEVDARGRAQSPPVFYRFELRRAEGWAAGPLTRNTDLLQAMIDSGYLPVQGPHPVSNLGYLRLRDGVFEMIYGKSLEGRMAATRFEKRMLEGSDPPRISHYLIHGNWFELGSEKPEDVCPASREGYPLWGSFTMRLQPWGSQANLTVKRCADHEDDVRSESRSIAGFLASRQQSFGLEPFQFAEVLGESLADMNLEGGEYDPAAFRRVRQPLFERADLIIYPSRPELCENRDLDAVYLVNSEARDQAFGGDYADAVGSIARRVIREHCGDQMFVSVSNYQQGDQEPWDRMSFQLKRDRPLPFGPAEPNFLRLTDHHKSDRAKAHDAWLEANHLGSACADEPFCALPGGRYLNAVYRGDLDAIRQMDHVFVEEVSRLVGVSSGGASNNPINQIFGGLFGVAEVNLLTMVTNKYMFAFPAWGESCLDPGAETKTFEYTEPVVIETDELGVTHRSGGEHYEASYTTNPEFFNLRDRIGDYRGARDSDDPRNMASLRIVYTGLVRMKKHYGCRSPEVKQFERQLIALTERVLADPGTSPPSGDNVPPKPVLTRVAAAPRTSAPPVTAAPDRISRVGPPALPVVTSTVRIATTPAQPARTSSGSAADQSGAGSRTGSRTGPRTGSRAPEVGGASTAGAPMTAVERQQRMNAEMQEVSQRFTQEMNALNQAYQQAIREAATSAARTAATADYQSGLMDLRNRAQAETQRVRQKYQ